VIKIKKIIFNILKLATILVLIVLLVLFLYSAFFYKTDKALKKVEEDQTSKELAKEKELAEKKEEIEKTNDQEKNITNKNEKIIKNIQTTLKDGLFATIGDQAVTRSDIVNEIKTILILNNMSYSNENRDELQQMAVKQVVKRNVKKIEIKRYDFLEFNTSDLSGQLNMMAENINMDVPTLKEICAANGLNFSIIEDQIVTDLLWNSLIFYLYSNRISLNQEEIENQLKFYQNKKDINEYLISEIVIPLEKQSEIESVVEKVKKEIEANGFQNTAMKLSVSQSASNGGDLGWINENQISKNFREIITTTPVGGLSKPIALKENILFFKIRNKKKIEKKIDLEELKNQIVNSEKTKILNMYSRSHYESLRRLTPIKFLNE